ncbi:hypothetical protein KOI35_00730 [Actinoplanes bogorensis]|uniref:Uncharacterized protein n=1 Tax=Paractinoplanes bogorensis TaxID=1610840 RepID=A0ABS5YF59_9ACTN|nr:hypothetical protein [Actinoplanes bogorensis]MBU2662022.1 hypothetical protein [Actinoplanes bogorensis]
MEPVPVTHKVRRTVRMAVALVVGQALLCALIGWLTLGRARPDDPAPPGSVVDQLAAPPLAAPPVPVPSSSSSRAPAVSSTRERKAIRPAPTTTAPVPTRTPQPISVPPEEPAIVPPVPPAPSPSASPSVSVPVSASPITVPSPVTTPSPPAKAPDEVQQPVVVGDECRPEGALGRTAEGELVKCVRDGRHRARWKIV